MTGITGTLTATSIALTAAMAFAPAQAAEHETTSSMAIICQNRMFAGEYIVRQHPTIAPITAEGLNNSLGEELVASVRDMGVDGYLLITPVDRAQDCEEFMKKIREISYIENIGPNIPDMPYQPPEP